MESRITKYLSVVFLFSILQFALPTNSHATTIEVVSSQDAYLVSGGVVNYSNFTKDRSEAANCTTCFWKIKAICKSWQDSSHGSCPWLRLQCPANMQLVEVFRFNGLYRPNYYSSDWYFVGYSCIGESGPISTVQIADSLLDEWLIRVPKLQIKYSPPNDAILRQPIRYEVLSDQSLAFTKTVAGVKTHLTSGSNLSFNCLDQKGNSNCVTQSSGNLKFGKTGLLSLSAKSVWTAEFEIDGVSGIEITGPQPSSSVSKIINVHPLFTHLKDPKKGRI